MARRAMRSVGVRNGGPSVFVHHPSREERRARGKSLRDGCPRSSHAGWKAPSGRPDPVQLVLQADAGRLPELLPLRHGRMALSPFTFYRGAALNMAVDLARTPATGLRCQCCGDAHLVNFRGFATPERRHIFAINDLDETLPGPWEWDLKRLTTSFVVACRDNGLPDSFAREAVLICSRSYRERMAEFAEMKVLDLWYRAIDSDELIGGIKDIALRQRAILRLEKERARNVAEDFFPKVSGPSGKAPAFEDQRPTLFHARGHRPGKVHPEVLEGFALYRQSLAPSHRQLLDRFEVKDAALKVVGVGSVGTVCWVGLFVADEGESLILQVKEARASVLEAFAGKSEFPNHGQRVVIGQRLMQPTSDMLLGWTRGRSGRDFYVRQLRDVKIKFRVETFGKAEMRIFADWCGYSLALSHARSGDPAAMSGYLGKSDAMDQALAAFSVAYADQNEKDHAALRRAIRAGKVKAVRESAA